MPENHRLADEFTHGLLKPQATTPPKAFYDLLGSRLFEAITALEEYTPTADEHELFGSPLAQQQLRERLGDGLEVVDLGAGSCQKGIALLRALPGVECYRAVDISEDFLLESLKGMREQFKHHPTLELSAIAVDFSAGLPPQSLPAPRPDRPRLFFYPGSSIGNFTPEEARDFLADLRSAHGGCRLLVGIDLVKPKGELELAYDDPVGVTAAFNRNVLRVIRQTLGVEIDLRAWRHEARFNAVASRVEMHLVAQSHQRWAWSHRGADHVREFAEGDSIHTENSYKYTPEGFAALLAAAGWSQPTPILHPSGRYALFTATAEPPSESR